MIVRLHSYMSVWQVSDDFDLDFTGSLVNVKVFVFFGMLEIIAQRGVKHKKKQDSCKSLYTKKINYSLTCAGEKYISQYELKNINNMVIIEVLTLH